MIGVIIDSSDVLAARDWSNAESIHIRTHRLKYRGLLLHALKYAFWALKPGGELVIEDSGPSEDFTSPFTIPFSLVRMVTFQALGSETKTLEIDITRNLIRLQRVVKPPSNSWQAGVIISGNPSETDNLIKCIEGLAAQPELQHTDGILLCGPYGANKILNDMPGKGFLRMVPYEYSESKYFPICEKKNHLIHAMTADRFVILHTRIRLDPNVLRHAPKEFDIAAPQIWTESGGLRRAHISCTIQDAGLPYRYSRISNLGTRSGGDPRLQMGKRQPFVDGGAFFASRRAYLNCPLNNQLGWGDSEDVEWCNRALSMGLLVDYWPDVQGVTMVDKLSTAMDLPSTVFLLAQIVKRQVTYLKKFSKHIIESLLGKR
jgi:hypothetical protein